jgi:hypothetical protein
LIPDSTIIIIIGVCSLATLNRNIKLLNLFPLTTLSFLREPEVRHLIGFGQIQTEP